MITSCSPINTLSNVSIYPLVINKEGKFTSAMRTVTPSCPSKAYASCSESESSPVLETSNTNYRSRRTKYRRCSRLPSCDSCKSHASKVSLLLSFPPQSYSQLPQHRLHLIDRGLLLALDTLDVISYGLEIDGLLFLVRIHVTWDAEVPVVRLDL